jgi:hypothetical protein
MPQISLKQQIIAYYLRTLNAESEARERANLGAFFLDTAETLSCCVIVDGNGLIRAGCEP